MKTLVLASSFKRAYKKLLRRQPEIKIIVDERLALLAIDPFDPTLQSHKLKGKLSGSWACSVEYDCQIVFNFVENAESGEEEILLIDIGSHDEVY